MSEILLYTEVLPREAVVRLAQAGVVAVKVKNIKNYKFVQPAQDSISCNQFVWALLDGISKSTSSFGNEARERIVKNLAILANEWRSQQPHSVTTEVKS